MTDTALLPAPASHAATDSRRIAAVAGISFVATLLVGATGFQAINPAAAAPIDAPQSKQTIKADKAVAKAEAAVAKAPQSPAARAGLGNAYLAAGRFVSAATAFDDALSLGDNSGRTALSLALARIGMGQPRQAVALLDDWRNDIPAGDLGLAYALAGETSRGVAILADAVRGGDATAKVRQNLAYAYALDGRWTEAKLMAAQDVPADQLDKRLATWALSMLPDRNVDRVATLIGAPVRPLDPGQPEALALKASPAESQLAMQQAPAPAPAPVPVAPAPGAELAPLAQAEPAPAAPAAPVVQANLALQQQPLRAPAVAVRRGVPAAGPATAPVAAPARARTAMVTTRVKPLGKAAANGTHFVQLGAFASQQGARRAWTVYTRRDPGLAAYRMTITPATVKGKQVWRVAAGGLTGRLAANTLCSRLKASGGACFAYGPSLPAKASPVPGTPAVLASGPQRARR